jgi:NADH:ubiquinone reductase (non-electrogenic)
VSLTLIRSSDDQSLLREVSDKTLLLSNGEVLPYGFCVWAAGNGCLPFVQSFIDSMDEQKSMQATARGRIVTDPWLKVLGTKNIFSIGDCAFIKENPLPATAQVASQGGAYLGRLFSKGYSLATTAMTPPYRSTDPDASDKTLHYFSQQSRIGALGIDPVKALDSSSAAVAAGLNITDIEFARPFQFLNLGILAYVGASKALAQISVDDKFVLGSGTLGFLLWRGIYWFKQVSWRNRFLVGIDWFRSRLFGRDIGAF